MQNYTAEKITIYQKTYQMPTLTDTSFQRLQFQVKQRQEVIKNQERVVIEQQQVKKKGLFSLTSYWETVDIKTNQVLSCEDKLDEVERLMNEYGQLMDLMIRHQNLYIQLFIELIEDLKLVITERIREISQQEKERLELLLWENSSDLRDVLEGQKKQIIGNIWLFGQSFLSILRKIRLMDEFTTEVKTSQDNQQQELREIDDRINKYKKVYNLQRKINQSGEEAERVAERAVNLGAYLEPFMVSFQAVIKQSCQQDKILREIINEIQSLADSMINSNTEELMALIDDSSSKTMLDFLISDRKTKQSLFTTIENAKQQKIDWSWQQIDSRDYDDLVTALVTLQAHIDSELDRYSQDFLSLISQSKSEKSLPNSIGKGETMIALESDKNIDYQLLESLLSQKKWREADKHTADLMLKIMDKNQWWDVSSDDLLNFSKTDLHTLDQLWLNYSDGRFGFSVQKQVWLDCGGEIGVYDDEMIDKFADQVQWRKNGNWLSYDQICFNDDAIKGHLPEWTCVRGIGFIAFLASRL